MGGTRPRTTVFRCSLWSPRHGRRRGSPATLTQRAEPPAPPRADRGPTPAPPRGGGEHRARGRCACPPRTGPPSSPGVTGPWATHAAAVTRQLVMRPSAALPPSSTMPVGTGPRPASLRVARPTPAPLVNDTTSPTAWTRHPASLAGLVGLACQITDPPARAAATAACGPRCGRWRLRQTRSRWPAAAPPSPTPRPHHGPGPRPPGPGSVRARHAPHRHAPAPSTPGLLHAGLPAWLRGRAADPGALLRPEAARHGKYARADPGWPAAHRPRLEASPQLRLSMLTA
ncbi:hypothetical protein QJS66_03405 [Kocuria rhizophila]|nr:hypothetical protein QJS66_03405 [Kocuria rhizophila]